LFLCGSASKSRPCLRCGLKKTLAALMDFAAMHGHGVRGSDPDADIFPVALYDHDANVIADHDFFARPTGQDQHGISSV
jgi:hypothetical protein